MQKILSILFLSLVCANLSFAQSGFIRGQVIDDATGEGLIGATVAVVGTTMGAATDLDGNFSISIAPGTYSVQVSYISYDTRTITELVVTDGGVASAGPIRMKESGSLALEEVEIVATVLEDAETGLLTKQKKSSVVLDGISSEQFSRNNDNDAASAVSRVTGVTLEGGKYVYVRGLGDRYSRTSVNGADIPGLDPNRNTVQMDLFPSNLLDNIVVYKTFRPDLPGDFTGGYVDISTKEFPEEFTAKVSLSLGYNPQANFNDEFLSMETPSSDFWGLAGSTRDVPNVVANNRIPSPSEARLDPTGAGAILADQSAAFTNPFQPIQDSKFFNTSFSASVGNQVEFLGKPLGFIVGLSHRRTFESYGFEEAGESNIRRLPNRESTSLIGELLLRDSRSIENILLGGLLNISYKFSNNNKLSFNFLRNQGLEKEGRFQAGRSPRNEANEEYYTTRVGVTERVLTSYQFKGEHVISNWNKLRIEWQGAYSQSSQEQPDLRFFTYTVRELLPGVLEILNRRSDVTIPTRFYRDMDQDNYDFKVNFTLPIDKADAKVKGAKLKFGGAFLRKDRVFSELQYRYTNTNDIVPGGGVLFGPGDIAGYFETTFDPNEADPQGIQISLDSLREDRNNYTADQDVFAAYIMTELPLSAKIRAIAGVRYERTDLNLISADPNLERGRLDNNDFLPSLNLIYSFNDNTNVRFGYSRTLARPTFRELAPFASFDFIGGYVLVGNPELQRTTIDNIDLRWETYPRPGEIFSISGFVKFFDNPIERVLNVDQGFNEQVEFTFENLPDATLLGFEVEAKKRLDFIADFLSDVTIGGNFTYIFAEVENPESLQQVISDLNSFVDPVNRRLYGQSPYVVNAYVNYQNEQGTSVNVTFNVNGERISIVQVDGLNVLERPRPTLNVNLAQRFGRFNVKANVNNILNPDFEFRQEHVGQDFIFQNSQAGITYSLGVSYTIE